MSFLVKNSLCTLSIQKSMKVKNIEKETEIEIEFQALDTKLETFISYFFIDFRLFSFIDFPSFPEVQLSMNNENV